MTDLANTVNQSSVVVHDPDEIEELDIYESYDGVELSPEEIRFVNFYVGEARFSASKAFCLTRGKTVDHNKVGIKWVRKPHIMKAISYRLEAEGATELEALAELKRVAMAPFEDLIDVKMRNGEVVSVRMDLASKVRANEIILRAHNRLDNKTAAMIPIQVNINVPGMDAEDIA